MKDIEINIEFSDGAYDFLEDQSRFKQLVAGRRFGKSYLIATDIMNELLDGSDKIMVYLAPTYPMAKKTMFYYLTKLVPNVAIDSTNKSDLSFFMKNGNILYLAGSQNYDSHRGYPHLNKAYLDECADQPEEIWSEVIRPALSDAMGSCWFVGTPKGRMNWFYDLTNDDNISTYQFTTLDGGNVSSEEIELAKSQMDERTFRQEYLATFESVEGLVYYAYSEDNNTNKTFNPAAETYLSWDFNVNPMSCIVVQKENGLYYAVKEFVIENANTELVVNLAYSWLQEKGFSGKLFVCGDSSGQSRKSSATFTDYQIIRDHLKNYSNLDHKFGLRITTTQRDRVNCTNALFKNAKNEIRLYVNKSECPKLDKDLRVVQWKQGGYTIDKSLGISDPSDALSYLAYNYELIKKDYTQARVA